MQNVWGVVMPAYREPSLPLVPRIKELGGKVIIVADDSDTCSVARNAGADYVICRRERRGIVSAVIEGLSLARRIGLKYIIIMDADGQHPVDAIPLMLKELSSGKKLVVGDRIIKDWSMWRRLISWGAESIARFMLRTRITSCINDFGSGFFGIEASINCLTPEDEVGDFKVLPNIVVNCGYKLTCSDVSNVKYVFGRRITGRSKLGAKQVINYLIQVIKLKYRLRELSSYD